MAIEKLRRALQQINKPCGLLNIIIPSLTKIEHDHSNYCCTSQLENEEGDVSTSAAIPSVNNQNIGLLTSYALVEET